MHRKPHKIFNTVLCLLLGVLELTMPAASSSEKLLKIGGVGCAVGTTKILSLVKAERRPLKVLTYNGVTPDLNTIADGSYPFSNLLYMITKDAPSGLSKRFVDFVLLPVGKKILNQTGNLTITQ